MSAEPTGFDRSPTSYGDPGFSKYLRRAFLASAGFDDVDTDRPIVGIASTVSDYVTCHRHMPAIVDAASRGVLEAGGLPMVFPSMAIGEILISPTSMLFRNLLAMETEELLLGQPMDSVILVGGCDKTIPGHLMGAISADVPAVSLVAGPMTTGSWRGQRLGACTDCRSSWNKHRAGELTSSELAEIRSELCPTGGTCMVMGTASTMASLLEALGMAIPGSAAAPSGSGDRLRIATATGRTAVEIARSRRRPSMILSDGSFANAARVLSALGGSTNAVIHLIAFARRAGLQFGLDELNRISMETPLLVNCKPAGTGYMEDFHAAGGVSTLMKALADTLDQSAATVDGRSVGEILERVEPPQPWQDIIGSLDRPVGSAGTLVVLWGSLVPNGAVLKKAAASAELLHHTGPAIVLDGADDAAARLDALGTAITEDHVVVVRGVGPIAAGMPEAGSVPIPRALAARGVKDMVRITDGRMSGTAYGTVILHAAPEAAAGGPLALVEDGDMIELDVVEGRLDLKVDESELARRRNKIVLRDLPRRGWRRLYADHVLQADEGADLDFLL
jgi:dihydroxy-acid dehydratase